MGKTPQHLLDRAKAYREKNADKVRARKRAAYAANREKVLARQKVRYAANRDAIRLRERDRRRSDRDRFLQRDRSRDARNRFQVLMTYARRRAAVSGREFTLPDDFVSRQWDQQGGLCYYTGRPMSLETGRDDLVSLDRRDSAIGYTPGNAVLCCWAVNSMKGPRSEGAFRDWCAAVAGYVPPA
jgi:hypothetical protein